MRITTLNDVLIVERPYQVPIVLQQLTPQERYNALLVYGVPQHIAEAVAHRLITINTPLGAYSKELNK